jgi:hypothetical protein
MNDTDYAAFQQKHQTQYQNLSQPDQQTYCDVYKQVGNDQTAQANLATLLANGTLSNKDSQGGTLLSNLKNISTLTPPDGAPYTATQVLKETVNNLAQPNTFINQGTAGTCGPTTIEYMLATQQPAEYARIVGGLMDKEGTVTLQGDDRPLARLADAVPEDGRGRSNVDRIFQASLQNYNADPRGGYSNVTDKFALPLQPIATETGGNPLQNAWNKLTNIPKEIANEVIGKINQGMNDMQVSGGIGENTVHKLYEQVLGGQAHTVGDIPGTEFLSYGNVGGVHFELTNENRQAVADAILKEAEAGHVVPCDVVAQGLPQRAGDPTQPLTNRDSMEYLDTMNSHQILVLGVKDGMVTYRNPWGFTQEMTVDEFRNRVTDGIIIDK